MVYEKLHESNQLIDLSRFLHAAAERNETLPMHEKVNYTALVGESLHCQGGCRQQRKTVGSPQGHSTATEASAEDIASDKIPGETADADEVRVLESLLTQKKASSEVEIDDATFKDAYRECFVAAFMADLNQVREDGGNSTLVSYCVDATATTILPSQREHFVK